MGRKKSAKKAPPKKTTQATMSTAELMASLEKANLTFTTDPSKVADGAILVQDYSTQLSQDCPLCQGPVPPFWTPVSADSDDSKVRYWYLCCGKFCCLPCRRDVEEMVGKGAKKKMERTLEKAVQQQTKEVVSGDPYDYISDRKSQKYCLCPFCETQVIDIQGFYTTEYKMALQDAALNKQLAYAQSSLGLLHLGAEYSKRPNNSMLLGGARSRNPQFGVELLHRAAMQGYPNALSELGRYYHNGLQGLPANRDLSTKLFHAAALQGHGMAGFVLCGFHMEAGTYAKALFYARLSSELGEPLGSFAAGDLLEKEEGINGVKKDLDMAFKYFTKGAEQGLDIAQFRAAIMIHENKTLGNDEQELCFLEMAAKQGHKEAQHHVGVRLIGHGKDWIQSKRWVEGVHWLRCARGNGSSRSVHTLQGIEEDTCSVCFHCFTHAPAGQRYSLCGKCKAVYYCSPECQRADWQSHKPVCKKSPEGANQLPHGKTKK